jgi:hypothetical protein
MMRAICPSHPIIIIIIIINSNAFTPGGSALKTTLNTQNYNNKKSRTHITQY